jgi:hypothetical protein
VPDDHDVAVEESRQHILEALGKALDPDRGEFIDVID